MVLREVGCDAPMFEDARRRRRGIRPVLEIESREAVRESVAAGIGVGIALEGEPHPDSRVHALRIADAAMVLELEIAALAERRDAPLIKAFFDVVAKMPPPAEPPAHA
jgi:DNA-binding transcriptional LysR family regulator